MPANQHNKRALPVFVRAALILLVVGAAAATAFLLPARQFELAGESCYTAKEYEAAAGLAEDRPALLTADTDALIRKMEEALPYANITKITRKLPGTLRLHVRDTRAAFVQRQDEFWWLISEKGIVLERVDAPPEGVWVITGLALEKPTPGQTAKWSGSRASGDALAALMQELRESELKDDITGVRITSGPVPDAIYQGRLRLRFGAPPPNAESKEEILREKLRLARQTITSLNEQNPQQKGVLDLSIMGEAYFSTNWDDESTSEADTAAHNESEESTSSVEDNNEAETADPDEDNTGD